MVWQFKLTLLFLGLILALLTALEHAYWWQTKEYRFDRFLSWVRFNQGWKELLKLQSRRPVFTQRAIYILSTSSLLSLLTAIFIYPQAGWWWFLILSLPAMASIGAILGVLWTYPIANWHRKRDVAFAKEKFSKSNPTVVAITGSFGKTSSKEFLAALLETKFKVVKTHGNENTELGIARRIIKDLKSDTQILVVEMGAYKTGEINRLCKITPPDIAWVTGIGAQHLDLFGNLDKLKRAKFEIIESLKPSGMAVLNKDSSQIQDLTAWSAAKKVKHLTYSLTQKGDVTAKLLDLTINHFKLEVHLKDSTFTVDVPLRGKHFAQNVLGAILIAAELGMTTVEIAQAVKNLKQPPNLLNLCNLKNQALIIDNSYNTNIDGFEASLEYLSQFSGKKYVLTSGIIELGDQTRKVHKLLGNKLKHFDATFVTNKLHGRYFKEGGANTISEENPKKMLSLISQVLSKGDVLLIEGRVPKLLSTKISNL